MSRRSPTSAANLCFFEWDWCSRGSEHAVVDQSTCIQRNGATEGEASTEETTMVEQALPNPHDLRGSDGSGSSPSLQRKGSMEDFAERFRIAQQALLGGSGHSTIQERSDSVADASRRKAESMENAMILTMLSSGDPALAQAATEAARSGRPLLVSPYQMLQVRRDATTLEIQQAYRRLALWHHPGRCCGTPIAPTERLRRQHVFEILAASYETLADREARRRCDGLLRETYEEHQRRSTNILQGQVRVGGRPLSESGGQSPTLLSSHHSVFDNFASALISQLAFLRSLGNDGDGATEPDLPQLTKRNNTMTKTFLPHMEPVSSDSSLDQGDDDSSDSSCESFRVSVTGTTPLRIQQPLLLRAEQRNISTVDSGSICPPSPFSSPGRPPAHPGVDFTAAPPLPPADQSDPTPTLQKFLDLPNNTCGGLSSLGSVDDSLEEVVVLPALLNSLSSSTSARQRRRKVEIHYTEGETNRLFGGPLQLLYRARRWKPFRDPMDVFADVFGSRVPLGSTGTPTTDGNDHPHDGHDYTDHKKNAVLVVPKLPVVGVSSPHGSKRGGCGGHGGTAASLFHDKSSIGLGGHRGHLEWTGTSETLRDGSEVFRTSRILRNRRMTRTEVVRTDPITGHKQSHISVTSEPLDMDGDDEEKNIPSDMNYYPSGRPREEGKSVTTMQFWNDTTVWTWNNNISGWYCAPSDVLGGCGAGSGHSTTAWGFGSPDCFWNGSGNMTEWCGTTMTTI